MTRLLPMLVLLAITGCTNAPDKQESQTVVAQFHSAVNAQDIAAIDALLTRSTRELRPGVGTARAFAKLMQRHGRYIDGHAGPIDRHEGRTRINWQARYVNGPVNEQFVLMHEAGVVKIEGYTDDPRL
ncbi:hypothetical protein [Sandarakinorhabdus sp.]|uniref:hypothetical protein n=1 Tax=Sandarakinorhabdus sp. TaxID=1916663 RepID=UPI003340E768